MVTPFPMLACRTVVNSGFKCSYKIRQKPALQLAFIYYFYNHYSHTRLMSMQCVVLQFSH